MASDSINNVSSSLDSIHSKLANLANETKQLTGNLGSKIDVLETSESDLSREVKAQYDKCENIIQDLYEAKLAIMEDERSALYLSEEVHGYRIYKRLLDKLPWYKKIFKFQTKKLKEEATALVNKEFKSAIDKVEAEIASFTYESYYKQFEDKEQEKQAELNNSNKNEASSNSNSVKKDK